ncbi:MAG: hypothetical protein HYX57_06110 [Chloroflexi bacterium]|nr:hypothetical protein [Chloroflexota bacterium]
MGPNAKSITPAAAALLLAVTACQSGNGDTGSQPAIDQPTNAPSPSPALLASGTFRFPPMDAAVVLDATGEGSNVTGTMTVTRGEGTSFTVDLECALTAEDGRVVIGGDTTESTFDETPKGTRTAIVLKPGAQVQALFAWQGTDPAQPSCMAFLQDMSAVAVELAPIEGTVQLGP